MIGSPYLTAGFADPELVRQIKKSVAGMAHFAATGPFGTQCKDCRFFGYSRIYRSGTGDAEKTVFQRSRCGKFFELTRRHGAQVPADTESCKYFERRSVTL
jgi:hypothetical protein